MFSLRFLKSYLFIFILFERLRDRIFHLPATTGSGPHWSQEPGTWSGFPHVWQGPKYLSHHLLPPRVWDSRTLDGKWTWNSSQVLCYGTQVSQVASSGLCQMPTLSFRVFFWGLLQDFFPLTWLVCAIFIVFTRQKGTEASDSKKCFGRSICFFSASSRASPCVTVLTLRLGHRHWTWLPECPPIFKKHEIFSQEIPDMGILLKNRSNNVELELLPVSSWSQQPLSCISRHRLAMALTTPCFCLCLAQIPCLNLFALLFAISFWIIPIVIIYKDGNEKIGAWVFSLPSLVTASRWQLTFWFRLYFCWASLKRWERHRQRDSKNHLTKTFIIGIQLMLRKPLIERICFAILQLYQCLYKITLCVFKQFNIYSVCCLK